MGGTLRALAHVKRVRRVASDAHADGAILQVLVCFSEQLPALGRPARSTGTGMPTGSEAKDLGVVVARTQRIIEILKVNRRVVSL